MENDTIVICKQCDYENELISFYNKRTFLYKCPNCGNESNEASDILYDIPTLKPSKSKKTTKTKEKIMTQEKKINFMRIACAIAGYNFSNSQLDLLISLYELIQEKKEKANLKQIAEVQKIVKDRTIKQELEKMKTSKS